MLKRTIAVISAVILLLSCVPLTSSAVNFTGNDKINIVLDPGHGAKDSGACHNGYYEKNFNLRIATLVRDKLNANGSFNVYMTRSDDSFLEVVDRGLYANTVNADLLISIHCDSSANPAADGVTAYTSVIGDCALVSLGKSITSKVASCVGMRSNGVYQRQDDAGYYWNSERRWDIKDSSLGKLSDYYGIPTWCAKFKVQSMIVEHGFMSNSHDLSILASDSNLRKIADAEASAIISYYTGHTHKYGSATTDFQSNCVFRGKKSERCSVCSHRRNVTYLPTAPANHYWEKVDGKWICRITENLNSKHHPIKNHINAVYKGKAGNDLTWTFDNSNGKLSFTGSGAVYNYSSTKPAPWKKYADQCVSVSVGSGVTAIGSYAFWGFSDVKSIKIPEKCTKIEKSAFLGCSSLAKAELPGVVSIGSGAFSGCTALKDVYVNKSNCKVDASPKTMGVPGFTRIRGYDGTAAQSFAYRNGYMFVNLKTGETSGKAGDAVVWKYNPYTKKLTFTGTGAIYNYPSSKPSPWSIYKTYATTATVEGDVTSLGVYSLWGFEKLQSVSISEKCTTIGNFAFLNCKALKKAELPGVISIGSGAFSGCTALKDVYVNKSNCNVDASPKTMGVPGFTRIRGYDGTAAQSFAYRNGYMFVDLKTGETSGKAGDAVVWKYNPYKKNLRFTGTGAIYNYPSSKPSPWSIYKAYATTATVDSEITGTGLYAFMGFEKLQSVSIAKECTEIGKHAFLDCPSMSEIYGEIGSAAQHYADNHGYAFSEMK